MPGARSPFLVLLGWVSLSGPGCGGSDQNGDGDADVDTDTDVDADTDTDTDADTDTDTDTDPECGADLECDDGIFCDGAESCAAGICEAGAPPDCSDAIDCTVDACDAELDACLSTPNDEGCDDGLACTGAEVCDPEASGCVDAPDVDCDDGVLCTDDSCDEAAGGTCVNTANDTSCADGETCDDVLDCVPALCRPPADCGTWESFAEGFFADYCTRCHDGTGARADYRVYDEVVAAADVIPCRAAPCACPTAGCEADCEEMPVNDPLPTDALRVQIRCWIDAGMP